MNCPICNSECTELVYDVHSIPIFQNKVYPTVESAKNCPVGDVALRHCSLCDYTWNQLFDYSRMEYDESYQNEQGCSSFFNAYLDDITDRIHQWGFAGKKIVEIGCGKGRFLRKMWASGLDAVGFDPASEDHDPRIIRDYFSDKYRNLDADLVILRHTLEHISSPLAFLQSIASAVRPDTALFIEVPSFDWICKNRAFWDIFYEHCNYFSERSLQNLFVSSHSGILFDGQYQYVLTTFDSLRTSFPPLAGVRSGKLSGMEKEQYTQFVNTAEELFIWGAGAKGAAFVNLVDPSAQQITAVVDINPVKQNCFIGKTAHPVISPEELIRAYRSGTILVMNSNYTNEVKSLLAEYPKFTITDIGDLYE